MQHDAVKEGKAERAGATKEGEGKSRGTSEGDGGSGERAKKEFPEAPGESLLFFFYFLFYVYGGSRFWGLFGTLVVREGREDEMSLACFGCSGWDPDAWSERQDIGNSRARAALETSLSSQHPDFRQRLWTGGASVKPLSDQEGLSKVWRVPCRNRLPTTSDCCNW